MSIPPGAHDKLKAFIDGSAADVSWNRQCDERNGRRISVIPQITALLQQLRDGLVDLPAFKETFDTKTRREWNVFGLKGTSGAMFLNMLVLHVPDQVELRRKLITALTEPETELQAREQMSAFLKFLDGMVSAGVVPRIKLQPGRTPFLLSAWWHLQNRELWPVYYESGRWGLGEIGLFAESGDSIRDYFSFRERWLELTTEFQLDTWAFEAVLSHAHNRKGQTVRPTTTTTGTRITKRKPSDDDVESAPKHSEVQSMLAHIGRKLGLKVWIASNDHGRAWNGQRLGDLSIPELPNLGIGADAQKIVNLIDVLWLRGTNQLVAGFEIECSTSIYSGVLRMSDLSTTCPNLSFPCYIALPAEREQEVIRQLSRPTFQALDLHRRCGYFTIESLKAELGPILRWAKDADSIRQLSKWVEDAR